MNIQCLGSWHFPGSRAGLLSSGPQGCSARALGDEGSLHRACPMEHQPEVQHRAAGHAARGNCTFFTPSAVKGESWALQLLYSKWEGTKAVKLDGGGTFANK